MSRRHYDEDDEERFWNEEQEDLLDDDEKEEEEEEDMEEADEFDGLEDDDEELEEGSTGLGDIESMIDEGETYSENGNFDEAINVFSAVVEHFPESPLGYYNLGVAHFLKLREEIETSELWEDFVDEEGHYEEAVNSFEQALELQEDFVPALNNLATAYAMRGKFQEAIELWERSLEIDPDQPEIRQDLQNVQAQMDDNDSCEHKKD